MPRNEAETRTQLIDPAIHARNWTEDALRAEQPLPANAIVAGVARRVGIPATPESLIAEISHHAAEARSALEAPRRRLAEN